MKSLFQNKYLTNSVNLEKSNSKFIEKENKFIKETIPDNFINKIRERI